MAGIERNNLEALLLRTVLGNIVSIKNRGIQAWMRQGQTAQPRKKDTCVFPTHSRLCRTCIPDIVRVRTLATQRESKERSLQAELASERLKLAQESKLVSRRVRKYWKPRWTGESISKSWSDKLQFQEMTNERLRISGWRLAFSKLHVRPVQISFMFST